MNGIRHLLSAALFFAASAHAQTVQISADQSEFDQTAGVHTLRGNVVMERGTLRVQADLVTITVDEEGDFDVMDASGDPVIFTRVVDGKRANGRALKLWYSESQQEVLLSQDAHVDQEGRLIEGHQIRIYIDNERIVAEGGASRERVLLVFPEQEP